MIRRFINWWRRFGIGSPRFTRVAIADTQDAIERPLRPRTVWVIGSPGRDKWCVFSCPCGRSHDIMLNLDTSRRPNWQMNRRTLTINPSVDSLELDRCHFWMRDGRISWVADSRPPSRTARART
jgi:hypothetical protein